MCVYVHIIIIMQEYAYIHTYIYKMDVPSSLYFVVRDTMQNSIDVGIPSQYQYLSPPEYGKNIITHIASLNHVIEIHSVI